jgi:polyisoprenyl-teichoic acid--peptidoglycan teichoic acid transferase
MEPQTTTPSPKRSFLTKKRLLIITSLILIPLFIGITLFAFLRPPSPPVSPAPIEMVTAEPTLIPTPPKDASSLNVVLLGYGGPGHQGAYLSDAIVLAHFDFSRRILALIAIPRDIWVKFPDDVSRKINTAFALKTNTKDYTKTKIDDDTANHAGSATKAVVETVTGIPVNYYIGIDFVGFERAISSLGGLKVQVDTPLDDPWYPTRGLELELCDWTPEEVTRMTATMSGFTLEKQFPCRYERIKYDRGLHQMDGGAALKFTRSRHSSSDFARGERQQAVLDALKDKLIGLGALDDLPKFFTSLAKETRTDLNLDIINYLAPSLRSLPGMQVVRVSLSTTNVLQSSTSKVGGFILIPKSGQDNWSSVHAYITDQLDHAPTPTPTLTQIRELR